MDIPRLLNFALPETKWKSNQMSFFYDWPSKFTYIPMSLMSAEEVVENLLQVLSDIDRQI